MRREILMVAEDRGSVDSVLSWAREKILVGLQRGPVAVRLSRPTRTLDQNARLWPMLHDIAKQIEWYGQMLTEEEWKDIFTAALKRLKVVPGLDGGFVVVGAHTSRMTIGEMCDLQELMQAFGDEREIRWTEPPKKRDQ